jgi:hypothetical protein
MIRSHIKWLTAILITLVAFALALSMTKPTVAEAKRKPTRTPTPLPTATPAPVELTAPALISPPNGATVSAQVTFVWSAVPGAASYHLQAGLNPYFDTQYNIINEWSLTDTSYSFYASPGFVEYFPHLYWRVQVIDANNVQGLWSEVWYFNLTSP